MDCCEFEDIWFCRSQLLAAWLSMAAVVAFVHASYHYLTYLVLCHRLLSTFTHFVSLQHIQDISTFFL